MGRQEDGLEFDGENPVILYEGSYTVEDIKLLKDKAWKFQDIFDSQLMELFEINNPKLINTSIFSDAFNEFSARRVGVAKETCGDYIFFPWSGVLMHTLSKNEQRSLRTNRMRSLLNTEEIDILANFNAGIAGLSFGNGIALTLAYGGFSDKIKIADNDIFETTNLNRVRVGLGAVGQKKTAVTARQIYEINPYAKIGIFSDGVTDNNLDDFINGDFKLNAVFDVVDNFSMKVKLRLAAKKANIPVIMLTSLEDSILVDVERFDLNPDAEIFHGLLGSITDELLTKDMSEEEKAKYAMTIVEPQNISFRNLLSLSQVGKELVSRPHLIGTVSIVCGLATFISKRIALGEDMPSIRKLVSFSDVLDILPAKDNTKEARDELLNMFMKGNG